MKIYVFESYIFQNASSLLAAGFSTLGSSKTKSSNFLAGAFFEGATFFGLGGSGLIGFGVCSTLDFAGRIVCISLLLNLGFILSDSYFSYKFSFSLLLMNNSFHSPIFFKDHLILIL